MPDIIKVELLVEFSIFKSIDVLEISTLGVLFVLLELFINQTIPIINAIKKIAIKIKIFLFILKSNPFKFYFSEIPKNYSDIDKFKKYSIINIVINIRSKNMLAKIWKKLLFFILIVACLFNIVIKLVNKTSMEKELEMSANYIESIENEN